MVVLAGDLNEHLRDVKEEYLPVSKNQLKYTWEKLKNSVSELQLMDTTEINRTFDIQRDYTFVYHNGTMARLDDIFVKRPE